VAPETPGSIHEGGELGYALSHAFGTAFDNPDLIVACAVGDGEAETGPLAAAWHSNKFLNPVYDGAVRPILHLNGYKIANPTVLARISHEELESLFVGHGYRPYFVEGEEPETMHQLMAANLDTVVEEIQAIQQQARTQGLIERPRWPMIIVRTPRAGRVRGKLMAGEPRAPGAHTRSPALMWRLTQSTSSDWKSGCKATSRESSLLSMAGACQGWRRWRLRATRRMGANPHANGGVLLKELRMPDFRNYAVDVPTPGTVVAEATRVKGSFLRDVMRLNQDNRNFRFQPSWRPLRGD
jgi:xylulose-5-phosphate/fructose-6-phosphate phosphoketolase